MLVAISIDQQIYRDRYQLLAEDTGRTSNSRSSVQLRIGELLVRIITGW